MASDGEREDFLSLLAEYDDRRADPEIGEKVTGTIVSIGDELAFLDLGTKSEATVARAELAGEDGELTVAVGDRLEATVAAADEAGNLVLRVRPGRGEASRAELRLAWERKLPVDGRVAAVVKGGVEVTVGGMRAFCPISQLADRYVDDPADFVGERFEFLIERFEETGRRANVVVSRRALLRREAAARADELRERLEVGAVLAGTVTSLTSYGAFVDLGGLEGLLHVSELSHERVADPSEVLAVGQKLDVEVLAVEPAEKPGQSERISLSIRALQRDPWQDAVERFPEGEVVAGRVTRLETFGAFVALAPGIEGLVHVSRLGGEERVRHPRDVVQPGQDVQVKVLGVDLEKRRISLAREVEETEGEAAEDVASYLAESSDSGGFGSLGSFFKK